MENFFRFDNKFFELLGKIADVILVSILWLICCIPIVTIGASTTALYYTVHKVLRGGRAYVCRSFFESFRSNFKQATVLWMLFFLMGGILAADIYITYHTAFYYVFLVLSVCYMGWLIYVFPYQARFYNSTKEVIKNTAIIAVTNLPKTLFLVGLWLVGVLIIYLVPYLVFLIPALLMWLMNLVLETIFRKYMSQEDLAKEKENDEWIEG